VQVIIPAHNEESVVGDALPSVLCQDYPGDCAVVLVDERSTDATAVLARSLANAEENAAPLTVVDGEPLPPGWLGKVWGLEQGYREAKLAQPEYYLLTDADIVHEPLSLRRLVAESEDAALALNSRMARLRCESPAERLLIPAFVFFFNLLYPMRRVNDPGSPVAACAGGCVLVRAETLEAIGGLDCIRGEVIDDVNLARAVASKDPRLRLAISRHHVRSVRTYATLGPIWRMIRRTAFDELDYSWLKLAGTIAGLLVLFALPLASVLVSAGLGGAKAAGSTETQAWSLVAMGLAGLTALVLMRVAYGPAVALFELRRRSAWTLSLAGTLYGLVTLDSAWQHLRRRGPSW